ncbi:MAG: suppressor of fused domain protein [Lentisphaeraceae bacterium]|nr:suppressor of fused domain protein [Lentisphaeraceae bacterium]
MVIAELENWLGNKVAILEGNNNSIYLYIYSKDQNVIALWVANSKRIDNPKDIKTEMEEGLPPYMPNEQCNDKGYILAHENENDWELQWGLDQNSIAVWYKGKIISIMPEWSGLQGFYGYSIGTDYETPLAWPLSKDNAQIHKFINEKEFLSNWTEDVWIQHQEALLELYSNNFNGQERYFAIDGGNWPPKGMRYISQGSSHYLFTVGISILPMPLYGMNYEEDIEDFRRIELGIIFEGGDDFTALGQYLSAQSTYPWYWGTHFDNGHTIPCKELSDLGSQMSFMVIVDNASFLPKISTPNFNNDKTRLLYMVPIYESEQKFAEENSTLELIKLLEVSKQPLNIFRDSVV